MQAGGAVLASTDGGGPEAARRWLFTDDGPGDGASAGFLSRQHGVAVGEPSVELLMQFTCFLRQPGGQVIGFARIVVEVEQFEFLVLISPDQFPVARSDDAVWDDVVAAVMREVPVDSVSLEWSLLSEGGHEAQAVDRSVGGGIGSGGFTEGWEEIDACDDLVAERIASNDAGPADDERYADAAFVGVTFS